MSALSVILAVTEEGVYLRETVEAAIAASQGCGVDAELIVPVAAADADMVRQVLHGCACRLLPCNGKALAARWNAGAADAAGQIFLFLHEGIIPTADGLKKLLETLLPDEQIAAVGPFSNHTVFSWQYLNAEEMAVHGEDADAWVRRHLTQLTNSLFLEDFALLVRSSAFWAVQGFDEAFTGGGTDLDLSLRLKYEGFHLLRTPVYFAHRGVGSCELYDLRRSEMRPLLMERWGIDIGVPETILQETLGAITWAHDLPLIRATARTALLKAPLVSILIPTCSRPKCFHETLAGACAQTYPNIEVIVCDNSTDDDTEELMQAYRDDVRVRYVQDKNACTVVEKAALLTQLACGTFVQWCLDGDILLPDKLTLMVDAFLREPGTTLVTSVCGRIDGDGAFLGIVEEHPPVYGLYNRLSGAAVGQICLMSGMNFLGTSSSVLFRSADTEHLSWHPQERGYQAAADAVMWLTLLEKGDAVVFGKPLSLVRVHSGRAESEVRSGIEWRRLVEKYWRKRIFLTQEDAYRAARDAVQTRYALLPDVPEELRQAYEAGVPDIHILLMSRVMECAPVRLDAPLSRLTVRGAVSVEGCMRDGDAIPTLDEIARRHDTLILFQRRNIPCTAESRRILAQAGAQGNVLLQEMDDHPQISDRAVRDNYFLFRAVSAVQTSTRYLADFLRELNPYVYLFENQLAELPAQRSYDMPSDRVTIFFGALNRRPDWEPLMPALNEAIRRYGNRLYFRVVSDHGFYQELQTEAKEFAGGVRDASIVAPYEHYTAALHASDIALLPLNDTEFNRAKSDLKFIEAAGHGAAVLASPTVYAGSVRDGETGLIFRSPKEFAQKLDLLIKRSDLRRTLAENAYRYVAEHRLLAQHLDDYLAAYREMFERREELERERLRRVESFFPQL